MGKSISFAELLKSFNTHAGDVASTEDLTSIGKEEVNGSENLDSAAVNGNGAAVNGNGHSSIVNHEEMLTETEIEISDAPTIEELDSTRPTLEQGLNASSETSITTGGSLTETTIEPESQPDFLNEGEVETDTVTIVINDDEIGTDTVTTTVKSVDSQAKSQADEHADRSPQELQTSEGENMANTDGPPAQLFQDDAGNVSSMRVMSFVALIASIAIAAATVHSSLNTSKDDGRNHSIGVQITMAFLLAAFVPKALQKFAERSTFGTTGQNSNA